MLLERLKNLYLLFRPYLLIVLVLFLCHRAGLRVNISASLPDRIYFVRDLGEQEIHRGDIVVFNHLRSKNGNLRAAVMRGYLSEHTPMLKKVLAIPGDTVVLADDGITINGLYSGLCILLSADSYGNTLSAYPTPLTLSADLYWLTSQPARGFDSRYFGPVEREDLTHKATALM